MSLNNLEWFVDEEMQMRFQNEAPRTHTELLNKFIFNEKNVNKKKLKDIIQHFELTNFVNIRNIFLLTESEILEEKRLEGSDTEGLIFEGKVAIYSLYTGNVVINLNSHLTDNIFYEANNEQVLASILHETRHGWQSQENNKFYPHAVEFQRRYVFNLKHNESIILEEMENDAENYAIEKTNSIKSAIDLLDSEIELIDWLEVEKGKYNE